jgi:hypothetical protein
MREYKTAQAEYDAFIAENPNILAEMYVDEEEADSKPQPVKPIAPKPVAPKK